MTDILLLFSETLDKLPQSLYEMKKELNQAQKILIRSGKLLCLMCSKNTEWNFTKIAECIPNRSYFAEIKKIQVIFAAYTNQS